MNFRLIVIAIVLLAILVVAGCVAHGEFIAGAGSTGNRAASNISSRAPSGDHSTGYNPGARGIVSSRLARDDN